MSEKNIIREGVQHWHPETREYWFSLDDLVLSNNELQFGLLDSDPKIQTLAVRKVFQQNVKWSDLIENAGSTLSAVDKNKLVDGLSFYMDAYFPNLSPVDNADNVADFRNFIVSLDLDGLTENSLSRLTMFSESAKSWSQTNYSPVVNFPENFKQLDVGNIRHYVVKNLEESGQSAVDFLLKYAKSNDSIWQLVDLLPKEEKSLSQDDYDMLFERVLSLDFVEPERSLSRLFSSYTTNGVYVKKEYVSRCVNHPSEDVRALMGRRRAWRGISPTAEQVDSLINDSSSKVRYSFVSKSSWGHIKPSQEMVRKGLTDADKKIRKAWIEKTNVELSDNLFDIALADKSPLVRHAALNNKQFNLTPERIIKLLQDPSTGVRESLWEKDWGDFPKSQNLVDHEFMSRFSRFSVVSSPKLNLYDLIKVDGDNIGLTKLLKETLKELSESEKFRVANSMSVKTLAGNEGYESELDNNFINVFDSQGLRPSPHLMDDLFKDINIDGIDYYEYHALRVFGVSEGVAEKLFNEMYYQDTEKEKTKNTYDVLSLLLSYRKEALPEEVVHLIQNAPFASAEMCSAQNYEATPEVVINGLTYLNHGYREYDSLGGKYWVEGLEIENIKKRVLYWVEESLNPAYGREALILKNDEVKSALITAGEKITEFYSDFKWNEKNSKWLEEFPVAKDLVLGKKNIQTLIGGFEKKVLESSLKDVLNKKVMFGAL